MTTAKALVDPIPRAGIRVASSTANLWQGLTVTRLHLLGDTKESSRSTARGPRPRPSRPEARQKVAGTSSARAGARCGGLWRICANGHRLARGGPYIRRRPRGWRSFDSGSFRLSVTLREPTMPDMKIRAIVVSVVCLPNRQRGAGTRRVHQVEPASAIPFRPLWSLQPMTRSGRRGRRSLACSG